MATIPLDAASRADNGGQGTGTTSDFQLMLLAVTQAQEALDSITNITPGEGDMTQIWAQQQAEEDAQSRFNHLRISLLHQPPANMSDAACLALVIAELGQTLLPTDTGPFSWGNALRVAKENLAVFLASHPEVGESIPVSLRLFLNACEQVSAMRAGQMMRTAQ